MTLFICCGCCFALFVVVVAVRFRLLLFFVFFMALFYSYFSAQNLKITCPASGFKVGEMATVTCEVNKIAFKAPCILPIFYIAFSFTQSNGVKRTWCLSPYSICGKMGFPVWECQKCRCVCEKDNATFARHRLDLIPTSAYAAGNISCDVLCVNLGNLPPLKKNKCDRVTVGKLVVTQ